MADAWQRARERVMRESSTAVLMAMERKMKYQVEPGVPPFMDVPLVKRMSELPDDGRLKVGVVGFPWEGIKVEGPTVILPPGAPHPGPDNVYVRTSAYNTPRMVRKFSVHYSILHGGGLFPELERDLKLVDWLNLFDYGDVEIVPNDPEASYANAEAKVREMVDAGAVPLCIGGDHGITYPVAKAVVEGIGKRVGFICYDSHYDLSNSPKFWSASQWAQLFEVAGTDPRRLVFVGIRGLHTSIYWTYVAEELGCTVYTMTDVMDPGILDVTREAIDIATDGVDALYVTLDFDVLDPGIAPGQKYPEPVGITPREMVQSLRQLTRAEHLCGFDIVEMGPDYDLNGVTAQTGARFLVEVMGVLAVKKRHRKDDAGADQNAVGQRHGGSA